MLPALRFLALTVGLRQRPACASLVANGGVELCLRTLMRHADDPTIMTAALRLLVRESV